MKSRHVAAILLCMLSAGAARAADPDYAYAWPLQTAGDSAAWQVELTPEIYAAIVTDDLRDFEIVNAAGDTVPMAHYRIPQPPEEAISPPTFDLPATPTPTATGEEAIRLHIMRDRDGRLRSLDADARDAKSVTPPGESSARDLVLDASALRLPLASLHIDWNGGENVAARFAISASDDLQQWHTLVADATVLRLTRDGNVLDRHEIALDGARANYLRVRRIDDGPALPSLALRLRAAPALAPAQSTRAWLAARFDGADARRAGSAAGQPGFNYVLPAALAVDTVRVRLADDNSLVRLDVFSRPFGGAAGDWFQCGTLIAFRLHEGDALVSNDDLRASGGRRSRAWRIEPATPLSNPPHLEVAYVPDRFVFLAQGAGPYRLLAGSARARRGDYPVDAALDSLRAKLGADWQPPLAALGPREIMQGPKALEVPAPAPIQRDWKTWLLWAVLVAAAALIGGLALSLLRDPKSKA